MLNRDDIPDALLATDNPLDIPMLDPMLQAEYVHLPVMTWGAVKRNQRMPGTWHFYTQDYRYEALCSDPSPIANSACVAMVEPNFTTSEQMPSVVGWYQIYRKRWIARWCQTRGIRVFVDLNVAPDLYYANLLGVPTGWRAYMTRGYADRCDWTHIEYALACQQAQSQQILFAVYGGGTAVREMCRCEGWIWIPETLDLQKGKAERWLNQVVGEGERQEAADAWTK